MRSLCLAVLLMCLCSLVSGQADDSEPRQLRAYIAGDIGMGLPTGRWGRRQIDHPFMYGFEMGFKTYRQLYVGVSYHRLQFPTVFSAGLSGGDISLYSEHHYAMASARWLPTGGKYLRPFVVGRVGAAIHDAGFRFIDFDGSLGQRISEHSDTGVAFGVEGGLHIRLFYFMAINVSGAYMHTTPVTYVYDTATLGLATSDTAIWLPKVGIIVSTWEYDEIGVVDYW